MKKTILFLVSLFICLPIFASSQPVKAYKVNGRIVIDGKLTEDVWEKPSASGFIQRDPDEGKPASQETEIWMAYDEKYIYFGARMHDKEAHLINKSLMRRDNYENSDWIYLFLDPYLDKRTGYYFAVNAGGSKIDGILYNDSWDDNSWDGIWDANVSVDDKGWCAEIRIPFSQLRFNEAEEMIWGVNFNRDIGRNNEADFYKMIPKKESGFVSQFVELQGLKGIKSSSRFELFPYLVQKAQYLQHDNNDPFYKGNQYQTSFGADMKVGLGSNLNLDLTINPDFGQVEVDPAELNLSAFETYFSEKRPFFIEGSNIFGFGYGGVNNNWGFNFGNPDVLYSRRIGKNPSIYPDTEDEEYIDRPNETRILGAAKITGKLNKNTSIGVLSAVTQEMTATIKDANGKYRDEPVEPLTHYGVARVKREMNDGREGIGLILSTVNRNLNSNILEENYSKGAYVTGVDGWVTLDDDAKWVMNGSLMGSYVHGTKEYMTELQQKSYRYLQRPDATYMKLDSSRTSLAGTYARVMLNKQKGNWYLNSAFGLVSPGFENNDLGFQWMADRINWHAVGGYRWYESDGLFRQKSIYFGKYNSVTFEGKNITNGFYNKIWARFENYYTFYISSNYFMEDYSFTMNRGGPIAKTAGGVSTNFGFSSDSREMFVYEPWGWFESLQNGSTFYGFGIDLICKPLPALYINISPSFDYENNKSMWVTSQEDDFATHTFGERYVFGEMERKTVSASIRINWTFSSNLTLQWYIQPFITVGKYNNFKEFAEPGEMDYTNYGTGNSKISYNSDDDEYVVDPDGEGGADEFSFSNPDFNFKSFKSNLVLRWEFLPGSIFFLVWTHDKVNTIDPGEYEFKRDFKNLFTSEPDNIFLAKLTYWIDI